MAVWKYVNTAWLSILKYIYYIYFIYILLQWKIYWKWHTTQIFSSLIFTMIQYVSHTGRRGTRWVLAIRASLLSQTESRFSQVRSNINGHMKLTKRKITVLILFLQGSSTAGSGFQQVRIASNEQRTTSRPADEGMRWVDLYEDWEVDTGGGN